LAGRMGGVKVLASGTALIAVGYGLAGFTGSLYGVVAGLLLAGLGGATQHPIASTLVASAFPGLRSRTALGTYNFTGDVGKVALPAVFALLAAALGWRQAMVVTAAIAIAGAGLAFLTLQSAVMAAKARAGRPALAADERPRAFWL